MKEKDTYFGGKGADGVYQAIINQIPPHDVWLVGFAGHCAVTRHKRPAEFNVLCDLDKEVAEWWSLRKPTSNSEIINGDYSRCMVEAEFQHYIGKTVYTYFDPPYLHETRTGSKRYNYEMTMYQHEELIHLASQQPGMVGISHYPHPLYDALLEQGWRRITYTAQTRQGGRTEALYMNYPEPTALHDYRYLGSNYRERETIKRRQDTIIRKIQRLAESEKLAILQRIQETC